MKMNEYIIFTDSCCDIKPELLQQWGVPYANMTFSFDGEDKEYINTDITNKDFYDRMRKGASVPRPQQSTQIPLPVPSRRF